MNSLIYLKNNVLNVLLFDVTGMFKIKSCEGLMIFVLMVLVIGFWRNISYVTSLCVCKK